MIDKRIVDSVLGAARIEEVVGDFVDLRKKGVRYLGLCPFHEDRHIGNFVVYPKHNCFRCFSCGEHGSPVDFVMKREGIGFPDAVRWLAKKYCIDVDMEEFNYIPKERPKPIPLPMLTLPMGMVKARDVSPTMTCRERWQRTERTGRTEGTERTGREIEGERGKVGELVGWIMTGVKWDIMARARIVKMLEDYHVGLSKQGLTIWWQIDEMGQVRTGKMMRYKSDGHRDKVSHYGFDWIHAALFRDKRLTQYDDRRQEMKQTLFGMHLLDKYGKDAAVCIVESEKTALLMAIAYGNHAKQVWMACGGLENLSRERLKPIIERGRKIILYPDRDGIAKWKAKAHEIGYEYISVDTTPVTKWWLPKDGEKADIADVVIRIINESKPLRNMKQVREMMPQASKLIDDMDLEIENE